MMMKSPSSLCLLFLCLHYGFLPICNCNTLRLSSYDPKSPGETKPTRIEIAVGASANITCQMNLAKFGKKNSSSLYFVQKDTGIRVPKHNIEILNDTTIVFMLNNATEQDRYYVCKSHKMGIGITHVSVGTAPLDVNDFKCRGYNYMYMVCNFTIPHNALWTKYNLSYTAQSPFRKYEQDKSGKRRYRTLYSQNYILLCELTIEPPQAICNLTLDRNNYRPNYEFYNFTLVGYNTVGTNIQNFWVNHYESVIPPRPDYDFEKITTDVVVLKWHMPRYSYYTYKGLQYEIRLKPKDFNWMNHSNYEIRNNRSEYKLIIRNLPYAYYWYTVSVRIRVKRAAIRNDETTWSEAHIEQFRTKSCPPAKSPKTDVGSFYIDSSETKVRLYWQQLPKYQENGPDFEYIITETKRDGEEVHLKPLQIDRASAVFQWQRRHRYEFTIKSRNAEGLSPTGSKIIVPAWSKNHEQQNPQWIRNIYHASNLSYTLSWSSPINEDDLLDYSVFWCQSKQAIPNECRDTIQFQHVDKNLTRFNTVSQEEQQTLNLAVSANYKNYSSGMHWTMCTADIASDLVKLEPELTVLSSRTISLQWSSDRVCSSLLEGYNVSYCRISDKSVQYSAEDLENLPCLNEMTTATILSTARKFILDNLEPYSTYKIQMYMFSKLKKGKISEPVIVSTLEEAPSAPRNLKAFNITSNSVIIKWSPPAHYNGQLRKYMIHYNNENCAIECDKEEIHCNQNDITFKLENLSSFTSYKIYILAFTNAPSQPSNDIQIKTLIGIPSNPRHMISKENNRSVLEWSRPEVPSGRVEFYEVAIIVWYQDRIQRQRISRIVGSNECVFRLPVCIDADYRHTVQVRAVNVAREAEIDYHIFSTNNTEDTDLDNQLFYADNDDLECRGYVDNESNDLKYIRGIRKTDNYVLFKSVWEKGPTYNCSSTKLSRITMWALVVVVSSLGVIATFYVARNKYNKMANISCALPPGLASITYPIKYANNDSSEYRPSKESYFTNEHRHLLASISHDSCYTSQSDQGSGIQGITSGISGDNLNKENINEYCSHNIYAGSDIESDVIEATPTRADDPYMIMELLKSHGNDTQTPSSPTNPNNLVACNDYVLPELVTRQTAPLPESETYIKQPSQPTISSTNGYVKLNNMFNWAKSNPMASTEEKSLPGGQEETHNDYVAPHMLAKSSTANNGYTAVETITKQSMPPISGYVTQKELSVFGQQQKLN